MGTDIHLYFEILEDGYWKVIYNEEDDEIIRNYDSFGLLADIRNYIGVKPISKPRGLPKNISSFIKRKNNEYRGDSFLHSWLELKDFEEYNWDYKIKDGRLSTIEKSTGKEISKARYTHGKKDGDGDELFIYRRLERNVKTLKENHNIKYIISTLRELNKKYEKSRVIFWFD